MNRNDETLRRFDSMSYETAVGELLRCCGSRNWCEWMVQSRPFGDRTALRVAADQAFEKLSEVDWLEAFSHHPKIGDISSLRMKYSGNREWSAGEQAGAVNVDETTIVELSEGNAAYEAKFGFIFIVCATGKSASEMLAILQARLPNHRQTEIKLAAIEQQKISYLRMEKWELEE